VGFAPRRTICNPVWFPLYLVVFSNHPLTIDYQDCNAYFQDMINIYAIACIFKDFNTNSETIIRIFFAFFVHSTITVSRKMTSPNVHFMLLHLIFGTICQSMYSLVNQLLFINQESKHFFLTDNWTVLNDVVSPSKRLSIFVHISTFIIKYSLSRTMLTNIKLNLRRGQMSLVLDDGIMEKKLI